MQSVIICGLEEMGQYYIELSAGMACKDINYGSIVHLQCSVRLDHISELNMGVAELHTCFIRLHDQKV
jgi:hypothetical protein